MIERFVRPARRRNLAQCAVIFPLFTGLAIVVPLFLYAAWCAWLPPNASGWLRGVPFWLWMVWVVAQWLTLVRLVRAEPERTTKVGVFHSIQVVCLVFFALHLLATTGGLNQQFLTIWGICVEVAMVVFFVNYFLLALWTRTRMPWHAATAFASVVGTLGLKIWLAGGGVR